jgi:Mrp family chromosome partitioning ATPase
MQEQVETFKSYISQAELTSLVESFRALQDEQKFRSVAIISEFDDEGKTFVTATLALAYAARSKKRVLVVDTTADSNSSPNPEPHSLNPMLDKHEAVDVVDAFDENGLSVLLSGVTTQYGLVLVDTTSLRKKNKQNLDPSAVGRQCDAAIWVSSNQEGDVGVSSENHQRLIGSGINLVGVIHNQRGRTNGIR